MKQYLLIIEGDDEDTWKKFAKSYKKKKLGRNLNQAIMSLIKEKVEE